jgi:hypothetical protein
MHPGVKKGLPQRVRQALARRGEPDQRDAAVLGVIWCV